ncbi:helix-turn-helix domain-containing protein [Ruminococcaceae bacterium OttesenSCG-928-L11]|nr:helix-turn-helix domain-containing protein [Ruminococcaceae bacterium OttesenSCG-928-L11]
MGYFDSVYAADLPHRAVTVYMYLKNRANKDGSCFPAVGTIAKDLSLSKRTVYRALGELEQKGFVKRSARWREKGGRSSSLYELCSP